ncbi:OadG family transporter subunit [Luteococcus sp.]|uniref:OadG family transporter subunit n=1 Tax=Luteococcus sp. TaxID=1969402 RepID=UPI0037367739
MENLAWGLEMTVVGMGVVFGLLVLLMGVLFLMGRLDKEPAPAQPLPASDDPPPLAPDSTATTDTTAEAVPVVDFLTDDLTVEQAAAVTLAVVTHLEVRRQQAAPETRTHAPGSQIHTSRWVSVGRGSQNQSWRRR